MNTLHRWIFFVLLSLLSLWSLPSFSQGVVPVQATPSGVLLSPSRFFKTNVFGRGGITILPGLAGHGIVISNSAGDVSLVQLNNASNALRTTFISYDSIASNYLYTLILGGGVGEVNRNANAGMTNATIFGLVNDKSGSTNYLKTIEPAYALKGTNQGGTNLQLAVDAAIIPSHTQLNAASNILRTFTLSTASFASNGLFNVTIANDVIALNYLSGILESHDILTSNGVITVITATSNALDTLVRSKQHGSANLTNWSALPTNVLNGWQTGSALLTNLQAMGISNIVAGANVTIATNLGTLVISSSGGGSGGTGIATNSGSGTNNLFTNARMSGSQTNATNFYMAWPGFYFSEYLPGSPNAFLSGGLTVHGVFTADASTIFAEDVRILNDLTVEGDTLSLTAGTLSALGIHLTGGQGGSSLLRTDADTNIVAATIGAGLTFDGTTLSATPTATPGGGNKMLQFNDGGTLAGATNSAWDKSNTRLGIGTNTPQNTLHVHGNTTLNGIVTTYNSEPTALLGQPYIVAGFSLRFAATCSGLTTWQVAPATSNNLYRASVYISCDLPTAGTFTNLFVWTDNTGAARTNRVGLSTASTNNYAEATCMIQLGASQSLLYDCTSTGTPTVQRTLVLERLR